MQENRGKRVQWESVQAEKPCDLNDLTLDVIKV